MQTNVRKSLLISFAQTYVILVIQFIASVVIARLLTPHDFGIFSVSMVFISMASTFRDFGVVEYIVQEKDLTDSRIRAASMLTFLTSWGIALLVFLLSEPIASFYHEPDVSLVMRILALNFLLLPFGSVIFAHLRREMKFTEIAVIRLTVTFCQAGLAVLLAYIGFRYYSMAWAAVGATVVNILLIYLYRPKGFPFVPHFKEWRRVFSFGSFSSLNTLMLDLGKGAPDLVLGRLASMEAVALFGRATGLIDLFSRIIVQSVAFVALPHFSEHARSGQSVVEPYFRSVTLLTVVAWPFYLFLGVAAWPAVHVLYGEQWVSAAPLVQVLCIGEILLVPFCLQTQIFVSNGLVRTEAWRNGLIILTRVAALILMANYGLMAVASGYASTYILACGLSYWLMHRHFGIRVVPFWRAIRTSLGVTAMVGLALGGLVAFMPTSQMHMWYGLAASSVVFAVAWMVAIFVFRHPITEEVKRIGAWLQAKGMKWSGLRR